MDVKNKFGGPEKLQSPANSEKDGPLQAKPLWKQHFRRIFGKADIGLAITDRQGRFLNVNPAMSRLLGYSPAEMRQMDFAQITHADDRAECLKHFNELMAGQIRAYRLTKRYLHRDGRVIWVHLLVSPEPGRGGPPLFAIAMVEDITEEKAVISALRKSEERYRLLAENVSDVIWTKTLSGRITYISSSFEKLTGISPVEAVGMELDRYTTPASASLFALKVTGQMELEKSGSQDPSRPWVIEIEMVRRDGSTFWAEWRMTFFRDSTGTPIGILGVTRDLTESKTLKNGFSRPGKWKRYRPAGGVTSPRVQEVLKSSKDG